MFHEAVFESLYQIYGRIINIYIYKYIKQVTQTCGAYNQPYAGVIFAYIFFFIPGKKPNAIFPKGLQPK